MAFDLHRNFAKTTVLTPPSPALSGTSLVLVSGGGAKLQAAPFNATVWPGAGTASELNAEIVRVTVKTDDTLTITRAQEGSTARAILVGDTIAPTITAKTLTDIESAMPNPVYQGSSPPSAPAYPTRGAFFVPDDATLPWKSWKVATQEWI